MLVTGVARCWMLDAGSQTPVVEVQYLNAWKDTEQGRLSLAPNGAGLNSGTPSAVVTTKMGGCVCLYLTKMEVIE